MGDESSPSPSDEERFESDDDGQEAVLETTWNANGTPQAAAADEFYLAFTNIESRSSSGERTWETSDSIANHHVTDLTVSDPSVIATYHDPEHRTERVACFKRPSETMVWSADQISEEWEVNEVTFSGGHPVVYVTAQQRTGSTTRLIALDRSDGHELGSNEFTDAVHLGIVAVDDGILLVNSESIIEYTLDGNDAFTEIRVVDHSSLGDRSTHSGSGIDRDGSRIVIGTNPIRVMNYPEFSVEWAYEVEDQDIRHEPAIDDGDVAVVTDHGRVLLVDESENGLQWESSMAGGLPQGGGPLLTDEHVWVADNAGRIQAFSRTDGSQTLLHESETRQPREFEIIDDTLLARDPDQPSIQSQAYRFSPAG